MYRSPRYTVLLSVILFILLVSACTTPQTPAGDQTSPTDAPLAVYADTATPKAAGPTGQPVVLNPKTGGVLTFAMKEDVTSMDPLKAIMYGDIRLNILVAQQLVAPDRDGKFVGVLAEKWETSPDGKTWTFSLRKGVKFHNGQEMTAEDVKWIFDRIMDEKAGCERRTIFAGIGLKYEVVDAYTFKMTIESGMGPFLSYLATLNRAAIIHRDSYDTEGKVTRIIGTGPFMMDEIKPGESYTLKKFPAYWQKGQPLLDGVVLKVVPDAARRLSMLRGKEIDMIEDPPIADANKLVGSPDPNFTVNVYYINSGDRLVLNTTRPPFDNKNARLAVQSAIDRDVYNEVVYFGLAQVHNQPFSPTDRWYTDVPMVKPDLKQAQEYFKASGLPQGTRVKFMIRDNQKKGAEVIQAMLSQIGFEVEFDVVDAAAWTDKGKKYDYDLTIGTMTGIFDPDRPYGYLTKQSGSNWLVGGYDSEKMNELLLEGRSETDFNKRKRIYTEIVQLIQDDAATIYMMGLPWVEAWRTDVMDYRSGTSPALMMMDASDGMNITWLNR